MFVEVYVYDGDATGDERGPKNSLDRTVWRFYFDHDRLVTHTVFYQQRETARHKWRSHRAWTDTYRYKIEPTTPRPVLSDEVKAKALQIFMARITFVDHHGEVE